MGRQRIVTPMHRREPLLHNPALLPREELIRGFLIRTGLLDELVTQLRRQPEGAGLRHLLLIGPRGMGKTTLLLRLQYAIEDDPELRRAWLPVLFQEEQYHIGDLADLWLEILRQLAETLSDPELSRRAEALLTQGFNTDGLTGEAYELLMEVCARQGRRIVLLLDNLNTVLSHLDEQQAHWLRKILMTDGRVLLIGTATSYFSEITHQDQPFYEFFRTYRLMPLQVEEMQRLLRQIAERDGDPVVLEALGRDPERVRRIRILTGGNPRTTLLIYRLLAESPNGRIREDLERLLDQVTPFYKHQMEVLRPLQQRILHAIARHWHPLSEEKLFSSLRVARAQAEEELANLIDSGFIERVEIGEGQGAYQVAERMYNIYFLMRFSRPGRQDLYWLISFMEVFYAPKDLPPLADHALARSVLSAQGRALEALERLSLVLRDDEQVLDSLGERPLNVLILLARGQHAREVKALLDENPRLQLSRRWLPLAAALDVVTGDNPDRLKLLAPEVRSVAEDVLERIRTPPDPLQSPPNPWAPPLEAHPHFF